MIDCPSSNVISTRSSGIGRVIPVRPSAVRIRSRRVSVGSSPPLPVAGCGRSACSAAGCPMARRANPLIFTMLRPANDTYSAGSAGTEIQSK